MADPSDKRVPEVARACLAALGDQLLSLKEQILQFDRMIMAPCRVRHCRAGRAADRINQRGLLADEEMAGSVKHQAALLLRCLCWHEPHAGSGDGLANRLRVSHVILLPFDIRLYVSWWHQTHGMAKCPELARPVVRRGASLDADQTRGSF